MKKRISLLLLIIACAIGICACNGSVSNYNGKENINMEEIINTALSKCDDQTGQDVLKKKVVERFLTYVSYDTHSDPNNEEFPTSEKERELGQYLAVELETMGLQKVECDESCYVYATLPASKGCEAAPVLALICHMDVSDAAPAADIHTIIRQEDGVNMIRTDGKTLLGADDKSGLAEMVTAIEEMIQHPEYKHPEIRIVVTPDEETGRGTEHIDLKKIDADYAYTIDGEKLGELTYETWNASAATVNFTGYAIHPGSAYGKMKNASRMASDYVAMLPKNELPETTKDREGFYYVREMSGAVDHATVKIQIRDFEKEGIQKKKDFLIALGDKINAEYGKGCCEVEIVDEYPNMKEYIIPEHEKLVQYVRDAYLACDVELIECPVRGGTDGSTLSQMGLPTPNIGTGARECHSVNEHIAVESLEKMVEVIICLVSSFC